MRVVADSHAIVWYVQGSSRLADGARTALVESDRAKASAYRSPRWSTSGTSPKPRNPSAPTTARLQARLDASANVDLHAIDVAVADAFTLIPRTVLTDPWDRFIVATAKALALPLVTRDGAIRESNLVETVW